MILTRHLRQNRLSNESKAASRSLTRKEFSVCASISLFLESSTAFSSFLRTSNLACIRCLMVFHICVKQAKSKWETAGPSLHHDQFSLDIIIMGKTGRIKTIWILQSKKQRDIK
jgi:hypothetical protein